MPEKAKPADRRGGRVDFVATEWKPLQRNTLKGFLTIVLPSGLRIKDCSLHEKNGERWVSFPAKPWTKRDGTSSFISFLDFTSAIAKARFQKLALAAIDELFAGGEQ